MTVTRRELLGTLLAGGGALSLGISLGCGPDRQAMIRHADATGELTANLYITVLPTGRIALAVNKTEIGQGVATGYSTLVAEELAVGLDAIDVHFADSHPEYRTSFGIQQTGGSTSTKEAYLPLRRAAASAREMLVAAAATAWGVRARDCTAADGHVLHAATGRSTAYGELTRAAAHQRVPDAPALAKPGAFRVIGKVDRRVDARAKVDGTAIFGIDVSVPDMLHAVAIHGPAFGAPPVRVHDAAARALPGVVGVHAFPWGVAVVAQKTWQALAAARAVEVEWGPGPAHGFDSEQLRAAVRAHTDAGIPMRHDGHAARAIAAAPAHARVEAMYESPFLAHAPMEPQNCTAHVTSGHCEIWAPTQSPTVVQEFVADALGLTRDEVLVHVTYCGGGFGRRGVADVCAQAALLARAVGRPVQLLWTRESDTTQGYYRPQMAAKLRGAVDASGNATAFASHTIAQSVLVGPAMNMFVRGAMPGVVPQGLKRVLASSALAMFGTGSIGDMYTTEGVVELPYRIPNVSVQVTPISSPVPVSFWRSVGHSFNAFAIESFVDELAHAARRDPFAFRRDLLREGSRDRRVLETVAARAKWGEPLPAGRWRGIAGHACFDSFVAEVAEVEIVDGRIRVRRVYCAVDCGIALNPDVVRSQMEGAIIFGLSAALDQEITIHGGVVQQQNFDTYPPLRMNECPEIIVDIVESEHSPTGVGEPGLPPIAPAVANAIFSGTGVRLRRLPLQQAWHAEGK